jgi:hypothetical protein
MRLLRLIELSAETVELLRVHRQAQNELRMRNRQQYHDHGLVFAKGWADLTNRRQALGQPLQANNLGHAQIVKASGVKRIKFHGLRHTCATWLPAANVPVHVVSKRLGHKSVKTTLEIYAHALLSQQLTPRRNQHPCSTARLPTDCQRTSPDRAIPGHRPPEVGRSRTAVKSSDFKRSHTRPNMLCRVLSSAPIT